jgi:hypothetical protein
VAQGKGQRQTEQLRRRPHCLVAVPSFFSSRSGLCVDEELRHRESEV